MSAATNLVRTRRLGRRWTSRRPCNDTISWAWEKQLREGLDDCLRNLDDNDRSLGRRVSVRVSRADLRLIDDVTRQCREMGIVPRRSIYLALRVGLLRLTEEWRVDAGEALAKTRLGAKR